MKVFADSFRDLDWGREHISDSIFWGLMILFHTKSLLITLKILGGGATCFAIPVHLVK